LQPVFWCVFGRLYIFPFLFMYKSAARKDECTAPIDLLLGGIIQSEQPEIVIREDRLRVGIFTTPDKCEGCAQPVRWLEIEFQSDGEWNKILGLDERNYPTMVSVLNQVGDYLNSRAD
jgi:hypothetical protein